MSIIAGVLLTNFESTVMSSAHCIIPATNPLSSRSIKNSTDICNAVKEVYFHRNTLWAHARGGKGRNRLTNTGTHRIHVNSLLTNIGNTIYQYFNGTPNTPNTANNFDRFHKDLCHTFLNGINTIRGRVGYAQLSYGQAQKLINLSFKYITCFSDYTEFADLFTHCHMVIDNVVLTNLTPATLSVMLGTTVHDRISGLSGGRFNNHGWTDFTEQDYDNLVAEYRQVIAPHLGTLTYIELEYSMWPTVGLVSRTNPSPTPISDFHI